MKLFIFVIFAMLAAAFASPQFGDLTGTLSKAAFVPGGAVIGMYKEKHLVKTIFRMFVKHYRTVVL